MRYDETEHVRTEPPFSFLISAPPFGVLRHERIDNTNDDDELRSECDILSFYEFKFKIAFNSFVRTFLFHQITNEEKLQDVP